MKKLLITAGLTVAAMPAFATSTAIERAAVLQAAGQVCDISEGRAQVLAGEFNNLADEADRAAIDARTEKIVSFVRSKGTVATFCRKALR